MDEKLKYAVYLAQNPALQFQSAFDLSATRVIRLSGAPSRYVLEGVNKEQAIRDILLCFAHARVRDKDHSFVFSSPDMYGSVNSDFTHVTLSEATATGKVPKYPLRLYFTTSDDPMRRSSYYTGEVFYQKNGELGKYAINYWKFTKRYGCNERVQFNGTI